MKFILYVSLLVVVSGAPTPEDTASEHRHASFINVTTSAFIQIIKTDDVRAQDATYFTPAVVFMGKTDGVILRCLQRNPDECEIFHEAESEGMVRTLLISGEYIYAGLSSGDILRCRLCEKGSCRTVYKCGQNVRSLTIAGGYLHAALDDSILRCTLNEPNNCIHLHAMQNSVTSLIQLEDYIYAGTTGGQLMRCSLRTENQCTLVYTIEGRSITSIVDIENKVLVLTSFPELFDCTLSSFKTNHCVQAVSVFDFDSENDMRDMAAYNGVIHVVDGVGEVYNCDVAGDGNCSKYGYHTEVQSIAFAYSTVHMQTRYKNEHATCAWQSSHRCPPFVTYYEPQQRSMFETHVKDGKLRDYLGDLVDTKNADDGCSGPAAIFAMGPDGKILLTNVHKKGLLHSSSLFAGGPVAGAGEMVVENGYIKKITTFSEHYRPDHVLNRQVIASLRYQGYSGQIDQSMCCRHECENISSNTVNEPQENTQGIKSEVNLSSDNTVQENKQNIQSATATESAGNEEYESDTSTGEDEGRGVTGGKALLHMLHAHKHLP